MDFVAITTAVFGSGGALSNWISLRGHKSKFEELEKTVAHLSEKVDQIQNGTPARVRQLEGRASYMNNQLLTIQDQVDRVERDRASDQAEFRRKLNRLRATITELLANDDGPPDGAIPASAGE